jgi:hypothetical protein
LPAQAAAPINTAQPSPPAPEPESYFDRDLFAHEDFGFDADDGEWSNPFDDFQP